MPYDKRNVDGAMNMDDSLEVLPNGHVRFSKNLHIRYGKRENIRGTTIVSTIDIPLSTTATYKCIGAKEDEIGGMVVYFIWSSDLDHRILQYNNKTNSISTILIEQPGAFLNFDTNFLITGINIIYTDVNNPLLFWTDDKNRPRELNIEKAKLFSSGDFTSYYSFPFLETFIDAIKYPPLYPPTIVYSTDTTKITNNLKNTMYQVKYRYVYFDKQKSAFSPISEISRATQYSNIYLQPITDDLENNVLEITGTQWASNVVQIEIAVREGNVGDFYIVATIDRAIATATDAPFTYNFYNDQVKLPIEINESIKLFDNVPQLAKAQDYIESNRIVYGNIVEGYDNVPIDVTLTPVYNERSSAGVISGVPDCAFSSYAQIINPALSGSDNADLNTQDGIVCFHAFSFGGYLVPVIGDIVTIDYTYTYQLVKRNTLTGNSRTFNYPDYRAAGNQRRIFAQTMVKDTGGGVAETLIQLLDRLVIYLNDTYGYINSYYKPKLPSVAAVDQNMFVDLQIRNEGSGDEDSTQGMRRFRRLFGVIQMADSTHDPCQIGLVIDPTSTLEVSDIGDRTQDNKSTVTSPVFVDYTSFKSGAQHPFGVIYFDNANRSTGVNISDASTVVTGFYNETTTVNGMGKIDIGWEVKNLPPITAVKWAWGYAKNTTTPSFIQLAITGSKLTTSPNYPDAYLVSYQELTDYINVVVTTNPALTDTGSNLTYQWTKGDRLRLVGFQTAFFTKPPSYIDAEIMGTTLIEDVNYLIVRQNVNDIYFTQPFAIVEIYNTQITSNIRLYYEFGQQYPVLNPGTATRSHGGQIQNQDPNQPATIPATGLFTNGDVYFKQRVVVGTYSVHVIYVEDYNWLDYSTSNYYDKGRPNRVLTGVQRRRKQTMIPYSDRFIENTNINNLNSFFDGAFEEYEQKYGGIQLLKARNRDLIVYQELKVGNIPVNERLIANQNAPIIGQTDDVLNPIVYYTGEYGIATNPESWARFGFADYFTDVKRGVILRLSNNGIEAISYLYKINDYITSLFRQIAGQSQRVNIYGVFNKKRMQYEIAIEGAGSVASQTLAFDEKNNCFAGFLSYLPEFMCSSNQDIVSFVNGRIWTHETNSLRNNFYGVQYNSELWVVGNLDPSQEKVFTNISEESNSVWAVMEFTNNKAQLSNLIGTDANLGDFQLNEGIYYAKLLYDTTTPNVINPLLNGDDMRDVLIVAKLQNVSTSQVSIYAINFISIDSPRSNS